MALIKVLSVHGKIEMSSFDALCSGTLLGNCLSYPMRALLMKLKKLGLRYTLGNNFDILLICDLDEMLFDYVKSLPKSVKKGLITAESPVHCHMAHNIRFLFNPIWDFIITYNREFTSPKLIHYDIAVTGTQCPIPSLTSLDMASTRGIFVGRYKGKENKGNNLYRDLLISQLASHDEIVICGHGWPNIANYIGATDSKIKVISDYKFSIVVENVKSAGYVTEKLPDSILGERPALFFGDYVTARRRFGDTFVCLQHLTYESFLEAKQELFDNFEYYYNNCLTEKNKSEKWIESFIDTTTDAIFLSLNNNNNIML
jgi:hypothetical protein